MCGEGEGDFQLALVVRNSPASAGRLKKREDALEESTYLSSIHGYSHGIGAWQATVNGVTKSQMRLSMHTHTWGSGR